MAQVYLQIYDITNSPSARTNAAIVHINKVTKDAMGIGGIFHGAVQVFGQEWSFGYCERGSGVFCCPPKCNPMYTWRETIELGTTELDEKKVKELLLDLSLKWDGCSYDLLNRNCNHFCEKFCQELGVGSIPSWVNRFAQAGDTAFEVVGNTTEHLKQFGNEFVSVSKQVLKFFSTIAVPNENKDARVQDVSFAENERNAAAPLASKSNNTGSEVQQQEQPLGSERETQEKPRFLPFLFKNPVPSSNLLPFLPSGTQR